MTQEINNAKQGSSAQSVVQCIRSHAARGLRLLVVLSGPSHAGKSTLAKKISELSENFRIISPDRVRR